MCAELGLFAVEFKIFQLPLINFNANRASAILRIYITFPEIRRFENVTISIYYAGERQLS